MILNETYTLSNGVKIPKLGLGTWFIDDDKAAQAATIPQLCIRYTLQLGTVSLPKTANPEHMRSNAEVDVSISDDDMDALRSLRARDYGEHSAFPVYSGN